MLTDSNAYGSFSVRDVAEAKKFYEDVLGLQVTEHHGMLELQLPQGKLLMYPKEKHQPATFTVLNFEVKGIENLINELKSKGVRFESYSGEIETDENHIMHQGNFKAAWFTDPAGNILSIMEGEMA